MKPMKRFYLFAFMLTIAVSAFAQLNGDGYYRIRNVHTTRYIHVDNDKCNGLNYATQTADLSSISLVKDCDEYPAKTNPGAVLYIKGASGRYDLQSQGTGVYEMIQNYVSIIKVPSTGYYRTYASKDGVTLYLGDGNPASDGDYGELNTKKNNYRDWEILPISAESDNYLAVKPTLVNGTNHYLSYYASYPFSFASEGMKAWTVVKVDTELGVVVIDEIKGTVPAEMPVIIQCSSSEIANNRLNIGGTPTTSVKSVMTGVYFNLRNGSHTTQTVYDKNTMRVLGMADGKLSFVEGNTSNLAGEYTASTNDGLGMKKGTKYWAIPANTAYITVPENSPANLTCVTVAEYNQMTALDVVNTENANVVRRTTVIGTPVSKGYKGIIIETLSDGTSRKITQN